MLCARAASALASLLDSPPSSSAWARFNGRAPLLRCEAPGCRALAPSWELGPEGERCLSCKKPRSWGEIAAPKNDSSGAYFPREIPHIRAIFRAKARAALASLSPRFRLALLGAWADESPQAMAQAIASQAHRPCSPLDALSLAREAERLFLQKLGQ